MGIANVYQDFEISSAWCPETIKLKLQFFFIFEGRSNMYISFRVHLRIINSFWTLDSKELIRIYVLPMNIGNKNIDNYLWGVGKNKAKLRA